MEYWRFSRQCLCANEVRYDRYIADVIVLRKDNLIHEIEIKCCKSDLCSLEIKKQKHLNFYKKNYPHYFSFVVPTELVEDAVKIIAQLNPKYGLIEITNNYYSPITIRISPKKLHNNTENIDKWKHRIAFRLCSNLLSYMCTKLPKEDPNNTPKEGVSLK